MDTFRRDLEKPEFSDREEYRIRDADGEWRDLETVGSNLLSDPFVDGIVLNSRDITERKEREREIRRQNEQLEQFASVVSHDLRNPLSVAQGYLEAAMNEVDCEHHDDIVIAHDRMGTIIEDVLVLAQEGQTIDETTAVDFDHVAGRAWQNVDTADATLLVESEHAIIADADRLVQLLENLFRNAIEHGGEDVQVQAATSADGFFVEDDGPGIPAAHRQDVLKYGHTTTPTGTGFGLAIVSQIADGHGWEIQITESTDGGARFEFTIEEPSGSPQTKESASTDTPPETVRRE